VTVGRPALKIVYIMGAGHIGSTVVDIVLGHDRHIESLGEVAKYHRYGWELDENRKCACGSSVFACPFWSEVRSRWSKAVEESDGRRQLELKKRYEGSRMGWLRLLWNSRWPGSAFKRYQVGTEELYRSIQGAGGKDILIDSSLMPRRAFALTLNSGIDLYLIHMVRDGRGVMWSLMKPNKKTLTKAYVPASPWRTARYWVTANLQSWFVFRRVSADRRWLMRYEDFATDPAGVVGHIGDLVGLDLSHLVVGRAVTAAELERHTVGGNRVRMQKDIEIRSDFAWQQHLQSRHRRLFWWTAGWLARRYGYDRNSGTSDA
jgi:hypothetical protein